MAQTLPPPQLVEPRRAANPFASNREVATVAQGGGMVAVEGERVIAEVKAQLVVARANPRDAIRCMDQILNDCTRPTLATSAIYQYARGGSDIRGPSIRLMEAIAQRWGNIASGIKEIARHDGYSECLAFAWDLETNFRDGREFQLKHWRDTKSGGYQLKDERDIYELLANYGQRRKRACLLAVIPGDVVEAAVAQCEQTMQAHADVTPEGIQKLVAAFATFGVEPHQIEARIQRRLEAIRPAQIVALRKIFNSISDGISQAGDWFGSGVPVDEQEPGQTTESDPPRDGEAPPRRRGRPPGPRRSEQEIAAEARAAGRDDARAGHRDNAERWPTGTVGHADYELGRQDVEREQETRPPEESAGTAGSVRPPRQVDFDV